MSTNITNFSKLSELISLSSKRKPKIILNPEGEYCIKPIKDFKSESDLNANIICDKTAWEVPKEVQPLITELSHNTKLSNEEKILSVFKKLSEIYVYDDNLLSYIRKIDDDSFDLPDWYGRDIDEKWKENREQHNRRVCYEISRYLAQSLIELFKDNEDFNICILWDKGLTHYFVGLTCNEYSITLDLDDFNNIKDLTRLKTGLTAEGINILKDNSGKFKNALDKFNEGRDKSSIKKIKSEIPNNSNIPDSTIDEQTSSKINEPDDIVFIQNAIEILKEKYDIDSQGLFEYIKEIVDIKLGPESRKKIWKEIKVNDNSATRYIRCLVIEVDNNKYVIDVDQRLLRPFDEAELQNPDSDFIAYKELQRNWREPYDGT